MKKKFSPFILGLLSVVMLLSCKKDFLDRYPKDQPNPENFFVDAASARKAVNAIYNPWTRNSNMFQRDMVIMLDAMTDDSYWRPSRSESIQQERWDVTPSHGPISAYWNYAYRSVNAANFAIEGIPTSASKSFTAEQQKAYMAEARFLRAFDYLFLVTLWGDVPLITHQLKSFEEFNQARTPKADVFKQIIEDLQYAKANLPQQQSAFKGSPTKASAAAYLAKAYLYEKDYKNAEAAARDAITIAESSGYHLVDNYLSIWDENNEGNPELLFYIGYVNNSEDFGQNMTVQRISRGLPPEFKFIYGNGDGWGYSLPQRSLYDAFEPDDPRRTYTIFAPGDFFGIYNGTSAFSYTYKYMNSSGQVVSQAKTYQPGDSVIYDYRWSETGMNVRKMIANLQGLTNVRWAGQDVPLMRMSDLYLFLAEALAEQGKPEALTWVNKVRARGSVNMPPRTLGDGRPGDNSLVDIVRHERRVELAMEGERLFDLIRWGMVKQVFGDGTKVKRHFYSDFLTDVNSKYDAPLVSKLPDNVLFPIPQSEIDQNSQIHENNPGW
jgi:tetratricopeptide (TPR) repeat protein